MANAHYFITNELDQFISHLQERHFHQIDAEEEGWVTYAKTFSEALTKLYSIPSDASPRSAAQVRVTYAILKEGKNLQKLTRLLKAMNQSYRKAFPIWKTKRAPRQDVRDKRWAEIQEFLQHHGELIDCFKYQADDQLTEGAHSFNLMIASTPREQSICIEFIKSLAESFAPDGIMRGRRQADKPRQQRNGWIRRYALLHRKRGWSALEIAREIQRELRNGTWNERSRLQYNLANNTIAKIAGLKLPQSNSSYN